MLSLCVLFWSGNFILGRFIHEELAPLEIAMFRWLGVFILLLPYIFQKRQSIIKTLNTHFFILLILSLLGITGFNTILYVGLSYTSATNALLINSSVPILIILLSMLILKTTITHLQIIGVLISMLGVIYLALHGNLFSLLSLSFGKGDLFVITASLTWALYSVLLKFKPQNFDAYFATTVMIGTIILLGIYKSFGYSISHFIDFSLPAKLTIAYTVIFPSIISYYFWHQGIANIGADKTGQFTHLMPLFGAIEAYLFLGEKMMTYHIIGMAMIGIGIYLSLFLKKSSTCKERK